KNDPPKGTRAAPDLIGKLTNIKETLAALKDSDPKEAVQTPGAFDPSKYNPFDDAASGSSKTSTTAGETKPPPTTQGTGEYTSIQGNTDLQKKIGDKAPLDHCLIRFVDVTLEPGKTYKYRFKVRMMNPNYAPDSKKRKDTYPQFAEEKVLKSQDWTETPPVVVPPDQHIYALNLPESGPRLRTRITEMEPWRWSFSGLAGYPPTQE